MTQALDKPIVASDLFDVFDRTGKPIQVGSIIIYAHSIDRSAGLQWGRVDKIDLADTGPCGGKWPNGCRITVQGVDEDWGCAPRLRKNKGRIMYPDRVVVIEPARVPFEIWTLLHPSKGQGRN